MELDAPPALTSMAGAGAVGASSAAADGVLDGIAIVEAVVAVGAVGTPSAAATPLGIGAAAAGPPAGAWEPGGAVSAAAVRGGGGATLGAEGEEALTNKGWVKTRRHDKYTNQKKGAPLTWGPKPSSDPGSGATDAFAVAALLLLLLLVPLGEIIPRWWWRRQDQWRRWLWWRRTRWWWWRRTDAPLRALGLGAGFLGPTSSPLTLLGGSEMNDPSARRSLRRLSSSEPSELPGAEAPLVAPLPLSKGLGATAGPTLGAGPAGWGPPAGTPGIQIPWRGSRPPV
jgi:hypothetical protein